MPVIRHGNREIHYEPNKLIPHIKVFHQDFIPFGAGTDYAIQAVSAGKAREDSERLGDNHINTFFALKPFLEEPPSLIPSYDYFIYDGKEKKFPFMDIIDAGSLAPNQLIISYRLMGLLQKYRMAPHVTAPVVVRHRDIFIEDFYVMVHFWHHGCDLVDWENTVFAWVDNMIFQNIESTFTISSFEEYKAIRKNPPEREYIPLSVIFKDRYNIFYCDVFTEILSTKLIIKDFLASEMKNISINRVQSEIIRKG